jgi:hypothetical protein
MYTGLAKKIIFFLLEHSKCTFKEIAKAGVEKRAALALLLI